MTQESNGMTTLIILNFIGAVAALLALWKAGDWVVHYAITVARAFNVTTFFLGFIVLALAAAIPDLAVALTSAFNNVSDLAVGDIIGANFCDIALVIGGALLIAGRKVPITRSDSITLLLILIISTLVMATVFKWGVLERVHGIALVCVYLISITWLWTKSDQTSIVYDDECDVSEQFLTAKYRVFLLAKLAGSFGCVMLASYGVVQTALSLAYYLHMPLETVGSTILGIGTSLPEFVLSFSAIRRGHYGLALGPTLGTVLQQTTLILGLLAFCSKTPVNLHGAQHAAGFMFAAFAIMFYHIAKNRQVCRKTGVVLVSLFIAYMAFQVFYGRVV